MALEPTARESNFRDSIKKYFVDSIKTTEGIPLSFDQTLKKPNLRNKNVMRWVILAFRDMYRDDLSQAMIDIYCCTRRDNEGFKLAQLTDVVIGYLTDASDAGDGIKRITFYRSYVPPTPWVSIGGIVVQDIAESGQLTAEDETKYKIITVTFRFASKI